MAQDIIVPIHYWVDEEDNKIYDIEEMQRLFNEKIKELSTHNHYVRTLYQRGQL